jgi:4-hydroxy-3-methylbut-2-enyl diphosphate reductase
VNVLVLAPLGLEARAVRRGAPDLEVIRVGPGPRRARRGAARLPAEPGAIAVVGFAGALADGPAPGDLVVASEVRSPAGEVFSCPRADWLARELTDGGVRVWVGPLRSHPRVVRGGARKRLARSGAIAVDMETAWLAAGAGARPLAAVRAIVDTPSAELLRPGTAWRALRALRALGRVGPALRGWGELIARGGDDGPASASGSGPDTMGGEPRTMGGVS